MFADHQTHINYLLHTRLKFLWQMNGKRECFRLNKPAGREQSVHLGILEATDLTGFCSTGTRGNPEQTGQRSSWLTCLQGSLNNS